MTDNTADALLRDVETFLMVVEPRSHKAEAFALLDRVRAYLSREAPRDTPREPDGYIYWTQSPIGGWHRSFTDKYYNGRKPEHVTPYWTTPFDAAPAAEPPIGEQHPFSYVGEGDCGYCNLPREHPTHWAAAPAEAPPADDLVARLRQVQTTVVDGRYLPLCEEAAARIESDARALAAKDARIEALEAVLDARDEDMERQRACIGKYRETLRARVVWRDPHTKKWGCLLCDQEWFDGYASPEGHAPGCLASPDSAPTQEKTE